MLAGVLLHMIEAARPMDATICSADGDGAVHNVNDAIILIKDMEYICVADFAEVVWLAAGGWIEQSLIENNTPARSKSAIFRFRKQFAAQNLGAEIFLKRIVVI